jgi:Zn-dependent alcohol dehydrogenase
MYQSLPFYFMDKEVPRIIKSFEDGEIDLEEFKGKEFSQEDIDEAYVMAEAQKEQNYA